MRWTGDSEKDLILSLVDDSGTAIYGQATKDAAAGWNGFDYTSETSEWVGHFATPEEAKMAIETAVKVKVN